MKKILSFLLMAVLCLGSATMAFADSGAVGKAGKADPDAYNFTLFTDGDHLYIHQGSSIQSRIGGGIGRCKQTYKTFYQTFNREQAKAALHAEQIGGGAVRVLKYLIGKAAKERFGKIGTVADLILQHLGGKSELTKDLEVFIDSGKPSAHFVFKTRCMNRGHMYGDPMYDYAIESITMSY